MVKNKKEIRKDIKEYFASLNQDQLLQKSIDLSSRLADLLLQKRPICLGVFAPLKDEVQWASSPKLMGLEGSFAFPDLRAPATVMSFYLCPFTKLVETTHFGKGIKILTPPVDAVEVIPDLLIVPGLAFTKRGDRLGRGGGFYDRYLPNYAGKKVAICLEEQVLEELPVEAHDSKVDIIVTDKNIYYVSR